VVAGQEVLWDTTFVVKTLSFKVVAGRTDSGSYAQIVRETDTTTIDGVSARLDVLYFNNDSFPDIIVGYMGNNVTEELYLFDSLSSAYVFVEDFISFPQATSLEADTNYYYSYRRAGCADMNWQSDLFYIKNFKTYQLGSIYGQGCDFEDTPRLIEISKVDSSGKDVALETLPIEAISNFQDYKWGFIKNYWNKNLVRFK